MVTMADNIYRFRRLKWGDPEKKLDMLLDPTSEPPREFRFNWEYVAILILLFAIAIMSYELIPK